jgi:hypothetical protein
MARLKGLSEMPTPRRTLRQRYFRKRLLLRQSRALRYIGITLEIAILCCLIAMGIAYLAKIEFHP